jgi:hypothetical protein
MLWSKLEDVKLTETDDTIRWKWTADGRLSIASAYRAFVIGQQAIPGAKILHKTIAPAKCKFFFWLALHNRCWTAARRKKHNLQDGDRWTFCDQESETITHLLIGCSFSKEVWYRLFRCCGWQDFTPRGDELHLADWWAPARRRLDKAHKKVMDSLIVLVSSSIWLERNARIFNKTNKSAAELSKCITEEVSIWIQARFRSQGSIGHLFSDFGRQIAMM